MQKVGLLIIVVCATVSHLVAESLDSIRDETIESQPIDDIQSFQSVQSSIGLEKKSGRRFKKLINIALGETTYSISNYQAVVNLHARVVDGSRNGHYSSGHSCWLSLDNEYMPWWGVDLGIEYFIQRVDIYTRSDASTIDPRCRSSKYAKQAQCVPLTLGQQTAHAVVGLTNTSPSLRIPRMGEYEICGQGPSTVASGEILNIFCRPSDEKYRYVIVQKGLTTPSLLALCEVEVFGDR